MTVEQLQGYRLSPQQRRAWTAWNVGGERGGARCALLLTGELSPAAVESALERLVERHELLRTEFHALPGMRFPVQNAVQATAGEGGVGWTQERREGEEPEAVAEELLSGGLEGFEPAAGPRLRARLVTTGPERQVLLLALPPLCADGRSLDRLAVELVELLADREVEAPPVRYVQFSEWQNSLLEDDAEEGLEFWRRQAVEAATAVRFPFELPCITASAAEAPAAPAVVRGGLDAEHLAAAEARAAELGIGLDLLLLAAWHHLLWRYSRSEDAAVAVLHENRDHELFETVVGPFARWVPVRARVRRGATLGDLAAVLGQAREEVLEWADTFQWGRDGGEAGPFPAAFELSGEPPAGAAGDLEYRVLGKRVSLDRFRLRLACTRRDGGLEVELHHDVNRVPEDDAERLLAAWEHLLASAVETPEVPLDALSLVGPEERRRLLVELNRTRAAQPPSAGVHELFSRQAERTPDAPAVVFEDQVLSFAELDRRGNRLARLLRRRGVAPDVPVAVCLERSLDLVVALLGVLKAGGAFVPLEPWQPRQRLGFMLEDVDPPVVLAQESLVDRLSHWPASREDRILRLDADRDRVEAESDEALDAAEVDLAPENLAYVIFTSGSTGRPKGVAVEHRQLLNYVHAVRRRLELPDGANYASVSTFAADLGHTVIFPSLCFGGALHVLSLDRLADAGRVADYFSEHAIDCLKIVPSHLEALQDRPDPERGLPRRRLVLGGEASRPGWVETLRGRAPGCAVFNHYGPSETTVGVLAWRVEPQGMDPRAATVPLGRPLDNARVYLLDRRGEPVPTWVPGELFVAGDQVTRGYLGRAALTADRFVPDPFARESGGGPGGRMYRTGDLARLLPDGKVEFLGRVDDQVKFHGFRVELNEIRLALNEVPEVRDSVVAMRRDDNGRDVLVAYYVSRNELEVSELRDELRKSILEETLPNLFVHLRRLPLTLNGKVNHQALPSLEEAKARARKEVVPPRNRTEEVIAGIWAEVLGHERVSIHDNFFELGGHSLLATRVISRQREALGVDMPLRVLFEAPTVAGLARAVDDLQGTAPGGEAAPELVAESTDLDRQLAELERGDDGGAAAE